MKDEPHQRKNANPRSLEKVGHYIDSGRWEGRALESKIHGEVGESCGAQLFSFLRLRDRIEDPNKVLANPERVDLSNMNRESLFVLMACIAQIVERKTLGGFGKLLQRVETECANNGGRELSGFAIQAAVGRQPNLLICVEGGKIAQRYPDIIGMQMN
jgi:hypothetical protein